MPKPLSEAPPFLRLLADYLDVDDSLHNRLGTEAQDDLRAWADELERIIPSEEDLWRDRHNPCGSSMNESGVCFFPGDTHGCPTFGKGRCPHGRTSWTHCPHCLAVNRR